MRLLKSEEQSKDIHSESIRSNISILGTQMILNMTCHIHGSGELTRGTAGNRVSITRVLGTARL